MGSIKDFEIGQEVVAMSSPGVPCRCNPAPKPCRVVIEKIGRTKVHGRMIGYKGLVAMTTPDKPNARGLIAYPVDEARRLYREKLEARGYYTFEYIDELVEKL